MGNLNSKLFKKSFDLKNSNVYGGKSGATYTECSTNTSDGCGDVRKTTTSDTGTVLSDTTTNFNCGPI